MDERDSLMTCYEKFLTPTVTENVDGLGTSAVVFRCDISGTIRTLYFDPGTNIDIHTAEELMLGVLEECLHCSQSKQDCRSLDSSP